MKKVVLSFDDSRSDFYTRAYPILSRYHLTSTLNVISSFVKGIGDISFPSAQTACTEEQLCQLQKSGIVEIACHGANHLNTAADVKSNIEDLRGFGINVRGIGFASPNSVLTRINKNDDGIWGMVQRGELSYVRSGIQIRREGYWYAFESLLNRFIHSPKLFYRLNKRNILSDKGDKFLSSVSVYSYTTLSEIKYLINQMPDKCAIILMFHSILNPSDEGYNKDKYYWPENRFEALCSYLIGCKEVKVCKTNELLKEGEA